MAYDKCDPCCAPEKKGLTQDSFRIAELQILCEILTALQGGGGIGENVNISAFGGTAVTLGQKVMAASMPVVIASNQSALPITIAAGATSFVHLEDAPSASGDAGAGILAVRADVESDLTNTDGDYANLHEFDGRLSVTNRDRKGTSSLDASSSNAAITVDCDGMAILTWYWPASGATGTVTYEVTYDNTNWISVEGIQRSETLDVTYNLAGTQAVGSANRTSIPCAGVSKARVRVSSTGSGTVSVTYVAKAHTDWVKLVNINPGVTATALGKAEDAAHASGDTGVAVFGIREATPSSSFTAGTDGDYQLSKSNVEGYAYVDPVRRGTMTHTQPTITTATSFTLLAAAAQRKYLLIQNNSAANVLINLNNGTLTAIAPTSTNLGIVLAPGASYESPPNYCTVTAVTIYQTSGGNLNTVSVVEGV